VQKSDSRTRVSFIHNPNNTSSGDPIDSSSPSYLISQIINSHGLVSASPGKVLLALGLDPSVPAGDRLQGVLSKDGLVDQHDGKLDAEAYARFVKSSRLVARELHVVPGEQFLIVNGRVCFFHLIP
jgi:UDP-glucose:glycoprotein glucosyltransferase